MIRIVLQLIALKWAVSLKWLEMTFVVIWRYINKTEFNLINQLNSINFISFLRKYRNCFCSISHDPNFILLQQKFWRKHFFLLPFTRRKWRKFYVHVSDHLSFALFKLNNLDGRCSGTCTSWSVLLLCWVSVKLLYSINYLSDMYVYLINIYDTDVWWWPLDLERTDREQSHSCVCRWDWVWSGQLAE